MSKFEGFSEDEVRRLQAPAPRVAASEQELLPPANAKKISKIGAKPRKPLQAYKMPQLNDEQDDLSFNELNESFKKCKLSFKSTPQDVTNNNSEIQTQNFEAKINNADKEESSTTDINSNDSDLKTNEESIISNIDDVKPSSIEEQSSEVDEMVNNLKPDVVRSTGNNYNETVAKAHAAKLEDLQVQQKLMEEQNRRRKEMLSKALADRTKQTEEEVMKLDKIKRELLILDGQLSQDVAVLRKKIDQACFTYADAEKQYLRIEKDFLQAKINLQKEKEKKELLTEHLCALITHNETRKAQKLETLMEQLAYNGDSHDSCESERRKNSFLEDSFSQEPIVVDGVDERTGKMMEMNDGFS